ncbi:beta-propeller fold lactonase family protein [Isoptericola halotolerans]|uniref:lactonase family protein n=1 Tax=Isoptericola halotolerans TaxID=300560 RepID=UPI0038909123
MIATSSRTLWIGTYPGDRAPGSGEGVWRVDVDPASGALGTPVLAAEVASPSFLALHPRAPALYAVTETPAGRVTALRVHPDGTLAPLGEAPSGGDDPCHLAATTRTVWVANYGDGTAAALGVSEGDGEPATDRRALHTGSGTGPVPDRQAGPHAHQVTAVGDQVLVTDLGADLVRRYPVDARPGTAADPEAAGAAAADGAADDQAVAARLPAGTGPRHLVVLPSGALVVVGELDARLHVLVPADGRWEHSGSVPILPGAVAGADFGGHVTLSADGTRLHVGVRGADVLAVHAVSDGAVPRVEHLADVPLGEGARPRHHEVVGDEELVVVALEGTAELACVRVEAATGRGEVVARASWDTPPACVLVAR